MYIVNDYKLALHLELMELARNLWYLCKPRVFLAIASLAVISYLKASRFHISLSYGMFMAAIALFCGVCGANALNNYLDRDIDALMARTMRRPIPSGKVKPKLALSFSLSLILISLIAAYSAGTIAFSLLTIGLLSYIVAYTIIAKRRIALNIATVLPSIACPVWGGWWIGRGILDFEGFMLGVVVMSWGILHLWALSFAFSKDYMKVNIPMLPAIVSRDKAKWHIAISSVILIVLALTISIYVSLAYTFLASILSMFLLYLVVKFIMMPTPRRAWLIYKYTSPYILSVLLVYTFS
jgi:protoheme IX farnesyltransferase